MGGNIEEIEKVYKRSIESMCKLNKDVAYTI